MYGIAILCNGKRVYTLAIVLKRINEAIKRIKDKEVYVLCHGRMGNIQERLCREYGYDVLDTTNIEINVTDKNTRIRISLYKAVERMKSIGVKYVIFIGDDELIHVDIPRITFELLPSVRCIRYIPSDRWLNFYWMMNTYPSFGLSVAVNLEKMEFPFKYGCPHHGAHDGRVCMLVPLPVIHVHWIEDVVNEVVNNDCSLRSE